jgi:hypothetical protein
MPIDASKVVWDDVPDPALVKWDDKPRLSDIPKAFWQQTKDLLGGMARGAGSIGSTLMAPQDILQDVIERQKTGKSRAVSRNEQRREDIAAGTRELGANPDSLTYGTGKLGTEIAGTAGIGGALAPAAQALKASPALVNAIRTAGMSTGGVGGLPGLAARSAGGAITGGAAAGLVNPSDAGTGAAVGAMLPPALQLTGKFAHAAGNAFRPAVANTSLADKAINKYGIPLGVSDISASGMVKGARSALDDSWIVGGLGRSRKDAVQSGFNRAVGETFGEKTGSLTPAVMDSAKKRMGAEFDRIWSNNTLKIDGQLVTDLQRIEADAASKLNPEQAGQISRQVQNLLQKAQGLDIDGAFANNWQSELRMVIDGEKGLHKKLMNDLRQAVISSFNRSIPAADAAALTLNRSQYKAFKTVEPLLQKSEAGVAGREVGNVPAALLPESVRQSYKGGIANSPFADLTQIGSQFVADRVPRTGGSARAAVQNLAIGGGLMANPLLTTAGLGGAFGLEAFLSSPAIAKRMIQQNPGLLASPEIQAILARSAPVIAADQ